MKVGGGMYLWAIIVFLFFKRFAVRHGDGYDYRRGRTMPDAEIVGHDEEPLTTADVEREFASSRREHARVDVRAGPYREPDRSCRVGTT